MGNGPSRDLETVRRSSFVRLEGVHHLMKDHPKLAYSMRKNLERLRLYIERAECVNELYEWDAMTSHAECIIRQCMAGTFRAPVPKKPWYARCIPQ
jgi:hypothetical protein